MKYNPDHIYLTDAYSAIKAVPDKSIDMIYSDIPYLYKSGGVYSSKNEIGINVNNLKKAINGFNSGITMAILDDFVRVLKKINCFIWCSNLQLFDISNYFLNLGKKCRVEILTWNKSNCIPCVCQTWLPDIEYCLHIKEPGVKLNNGYHLKSHYYVSSTNKADKEKYDHPTIKPYELVERHILHASQSGDLILDPFMGSGTTALAAKNNGRHYLGFEINEQYYHSAVDRLNNITQRARALKIEQLSLF